MIKDIRDRLRGGCGLQQSGTNIPPWALAIGALVAVSLYCALTISPTPTSKVRLQLSGLSDHAEIAALETKGLRPLASKARTSAVDPVRGSNSGPLLEHMFVCVTFHWDVSGLTLLRQAVMTISHYPTTVTMCIISNRPELLRQAIREWGSGADHWVCGTNQTLLDPLHLAFVHRSYMDQAFKNKDYTTFMYLEHDMNVPWPALLGWAADTPLLEPLGFQRGFYRVEPSQHTGLPTLTDQIGRINITAYEKKLRVRFRDEVDLVKEKHFVQLPNPYFAVWVATRSQLAKFLRSAQWDVRYKPWAVRAMAACGLQFVDVPKGFFSAAVVPYNPGVPQQRQPPRMNVHAAIEHMSNKYCSAITGGQLHCTVAAHEFLFA